LIITSLFSVARPSFIDGKLTEFIITPFFKKFAT